jgi:hypothetical protein
VLWTTLRLWLVRHLFRETGLARPAGRLRLRLGGTVILAVIVFAGGAATVLLSRSPGRAPGHRGAAVSSAVSPGAVSPGAVSPGGVGPAAVARAAAARWVEQQVSRAAIVGCDPAMCAALQAGGFPSADLLPLTPAAASPLGSTVIVATSALRSLFGPRLAGVYAPVVLASFGSGAALVDVRAYAAGSVPGYRAALAADLAARRTAGRQLLANSRIAATAAVRRDLADGRVDSRLLITFSALAAAHYLRIVAVAGPAPGANAEMPLRAAELAIPRGAPHPGAYLDSVLAFLRAQRTPFLASGLHVTGAGAGAILRIEFSAPTPLGLLGQRAPS